jgi:hypothetical protein
MRRRQLIEIHEQRWCPDSLRDAVTDTLQFLWNLVDCYEPIVPRLRRALQETGTCRVVDLCSGGGGPWRRLARNVEDEDRLPVDVCLTDKFPNLRAFEHAKRSSHTKLAFYPAPVDATRVPSGLEGFRTLFTCFHHFPREEARAILQDAVKHGRGVGIFEVPKRDWLTILFVFFVPVMAFALVPFIRPFRWSRLLWTFPVPVGPFVLWFDGIISCLRAHTPPELLELAHGVSQNGYHWEAGVEGERRAFVAVTYLIGYPDSNTGRSNSSVVEPSRAISKSSATAPTRRLDAISPQSNAWDS